MSILKRPSCWLFVVLLTSLPARGQTRDHLAIDFHAALDNKLPVKFFGPNVSTVTKLGVDGLRISLPEGRSHVEGVGVELPLRLHGDFEIATGYRIFTIGGPPPPGGAGMQLFALFDTPAPLKAGVTRMHKGPLVKRVKLYENSGPNGETFGANRIVQGKDGNERFDTLFTRAKSNAGKLKLVRKGSKVQFWVADGDDAYHQIRTMEFGADDVKSIVLQGFTSYQPVTLDVAFTDVVIDADAFSITAPSVAFTGDTPQAARSKLLLPAALALAALSTVAALFVLWFIQHKKSRVQRTRAE